MGTYSVKSGGEGNISDLAKQNGQNVVVLRGEFEIGEQTAKLGIYRTGTIQLYNHIEKEDEFWSQIEGTITKGAIE